MATVDTLRNNLIDKLFTISNKEYLLALNQLVESSAVHNGAVKLTGEQILMLQLSDKDIETGKLISQRPRPKEGKPGKNV